MKYSLLYILILLTSFSCIADIDDDRLQGNIFDKDFDGEVVTEVEFIHDLSFNNTCYMDVYFKLSENAIESMLAVNTGTEKTLGWISAYIDGSRKVTLYSTDERYELESRIRINNVLFNNSITERTLEFYVEREIFHDPENERTLLAAYEFGCP